MEYIHYGNNKFDVNKFQRIVNRPEFTKPEGGFWASRIDAEYGWESWSKDNCFEINKKAYMKFKIKENSRVLVIDSVQKLDSLPKQKNPIFTNLWTILDFEKLANKYDAIEVIISKDRKLYYQLYGWDCDSILIMNPDIIIQ